MTRPRPHPGRAALALLVLGAGCAAPEVGPDIAAGRALLGAIATGTGPALDRRAAAEFRAAEDALIRAGQPVIELQGECDPFSDPPAATLRSDCRLHSLVPRPSATDARSTRDFLAMLDSYLAALDGLARSASVDEARRQADALVAAFGQPSAARPAAFEEIAQAVRARRALIVEGSGFVLDQVRIMALRRAVRAAAQAVTDGLPVAAAYLETLDPRLETAFEAHLRARSELEEARLAGDPRRYRAAVDALRARTEALAAAQAASPAVQLRAFGEVHARLVRSLRHPGGLPRIVALLEQLRRLRDAIP